MKGLRRFLSSVKKMIFPNHYNCPVVQVFLLNEFESFIGISNFYSLLAPEVITDARVELMFRDSKGKKVLTKELPLEHFAVQFVSVRSILGTAANDLNAGMVYIRVFPRSKNNRVYTQLGLITSHFFMFFLDRDHKACGHVHPQSVFDPNNKASAPFFSTQRIYTKGLKQIRLIQTNPSKVPCHMKYDFKSGNNVLSKELLVQPLGCEITTLNPEEFKDDPGVFQFSANRLPSSNAKPLLIREYQDGTFSLNHA